MLNEIKSMIQQKKLFQESANLLLENEELDDSLVLGEEPDEPKLPDEEKEPKAEVTPKEEEEPESGKPEDGGEEPKEEPEETPMHIPGDDLPTPTTPTGEPANDTDDIMSAELDLQSNTIRDVLPTPPAGAVDAVASDDLMNQRLDDGFAEEPPATSAPEPKDDLMDSPLDGNGDAPTAGEECGDLMNGSLDMSVEESAEVNISFIESNVDIDSLLDQMFGESGDPKKEASKSIKKKLKALAKELEKAAKPKRDDIRKEFNNDKHGWSVFKVGGHWMTFVNVIFGDNEYYEDNKRDLKKLMPDLIKNDNLYAWLKIEFASGVQIKPRQKDELKAIVYKHLLPAAKEVTEDKILINSNDGSKSVVISELNKGSKDKSFNEYYYTKTTYYYSIFIPFKVNLKWLLEGIDEKLITEFYDISTLTEAITLDGNSGNDQQQPAADPNAAPAADPNAAAPADDNAGATGPSLDAPPDDPNAAPADNPVTAAVKDKVDEMNSDAGTELPKEGNISDSLLKKLGNLTKGIEDTKKIIIDQLR